MDVSPLSRTRRTPSKAFVAWSAPSAIGSGGLGVGGQLGAEMTDFLVVLNSTAVSY
jgi:lipid-binding SYLF domain-containing protein